MQNNGSWWRNRTILALFGALVLGVVSAVIAMQQAPSSVNTTLALANPGTSTLTRNPPTSSGQRLEFEGMVTSIDSQSQAFVLARRSGETVTVLTDGNTFFNGSLGSLSVLQIGMRVRVVGVQQPDGTILATDVTIREQDD